MAWKPIESAPRNGKPILVFLEREHQDSRIHAAVFDGEFETIGGYFSFDLPKATHWREQPNWPAGVSKGTPKPKR